MGNGLRFGTGCHWRFKGEKAYRYGWPTPHDSGLTRMGFYNGDRMNGPLVDENDIEVWR